MKKRTLTYFFSILSFLIVLFAMDYLIGNLCRKNYFERNHGVLYRTTYSIDSTKEEILVFGSSRANHHYAPEAFEDSLKMSFFNTGREGCFIYYQLAVIKSVTKRYTPKIILLDLNPLDFLDTTDTYDKLNCLLPYYKTHEEIRSIINLRRFEKLRLISNIYPFNHCLFNLGRNKPENVVYEHKIKGFEAFNVVWNHPRRHQLETGEKFIYDTNKITAYKEFIDICNKNHIKLFVIISPFYFDLNANTKKMIALTRNITLEHKVDFLDFSQDSSIINHSSLFLDERHLNLTGANFFSGMLAGKIKEEIKKSTNTLANISDTSLIY